MLGYLTAWRDELRRIFGLNLPPVADRRKYARAKRGHRTWVRDWSDVTTICLHQTACTMGERLSRWNRAGCHTGIPASGRRIRLWDYNMRIVHGHSWNAHSVGIEVDGLFPGVAGDPRTLWDHPDTPWKEKASVLTDAQVQALHQEIRDICSTVEAHGGKVLMLVAHRQSSRTRRADPGSEIWQRGALPMMAELGLSDGGVGFEAGGYPIPEAWDPRDPRCRGVPY